MLRRNQRSEYIAQRRKGRKEKNDSELGVLGVLARANLRFHALWAGTYWRKPGTSP